MVLYTLFQLQTKQKPQKLTINTYVGIPIRYIVHSRATGMYEDMRTGPHQGRGDAGFQNS